MIKITNEIDELKDFKAWSQGAENLHNLQQSDRAYKYVQDMVEIMSINNNGIDETDLNDFLAYELSDVLTDEYGEEMAEKILTGEYGSDYEYKEFLEDMEATQELKDNLETCQDVVDNGVAEDFSDEGKAIALAMEFYTAYGTDKDFEEVATEINLLYPKNQSPLEAQDIERIADLVAKDMNGDLKEAINYEKEMTRADVEQKFEFENSNVETDKATDKNSESSVNKQKARRQ
jgi:hypothetical protein